MSMPAGILEHDAPRVEDVLPGDADGKVNLLPATALTAPLIVTVPRWANLPSPGRSQDLRLLWHTVGGQTVEVYRESLEDWPPLIQPTIPVRNLTIGVHELVYEVYVPITGLTTSSYPLTLTIKAPPKVDDFDDELTFPSDLPGRELTEDWLRDHDDQLTARLSNYAGSEVSDEIVWYWNINGIEEPIGRRRIDALSPARTVVFTGDMIRLRDNGIAQAFFYVHDRAGNRSANSDRARITVTAKPVPRVLPPPLVLEASGTGESQYLVASVGYKGVTVNLPSNAVIKNGDSICLLWGEKDHPAFLELPVVEEGGTWQALIPAAGVLLAMDDSLKVVYRITDGAGTLHDSTPLTLTIETDFLLSTLDCEQLAGKQSLSLGALPQDGATVILPTWGSYMAEGQTLRLQVEGVNNSGSGIIEPAVTGRVLTANELKTSVKLYIPTSILRKFRMNTQVRFEAFVSFNGSNNWQLAKKFRGLVLTLEP